MSIESVMPSSHLVLCHPPLLLPSIFPSIRVLSNESALNIMWPKYWCFSLSISPSTKYSGLISLVQEWELCPKEKSSLWEDRRPFNKQRKPLLVCDKILDLLGAFFFFYGAKLHPWGFFLLPFLTLTEGCLEICAGSDKYKATSGILWRSSG